VSKIDAVARTHAPLLCELHAHTTWSDGTLSVAALVDLYGSAGFDVLAITDHVLRGSEERRFVDAASFDAYLAEIEAEAERARAIYGLLVLPGLELTYDDLDPAVAAHALAVGLRSFVGLERGLERALADARELGAALIAAHPYPLELAPTAPRTTARYAATPEWAADAVDRFELVNRHEVFEWVARARGRRACRLSPPGSRCGSPAPRLPGSPIGPGAGAEPPIGARFPHGSRAAGRRPAPPDSSIVPARQACRGSGFGTER
jgi:3',5'-nucleoside bisphosphate phosphatase